MAELVDARDSKSRDREVMGVRFPLPAPLKHFNSLPHVSKTLYLKVFTPLHCFLNFDPLQIPDGGKAKIKTACLT